VACVPGFEQRHDHRPEAAARMREETER
jgi:hypothetical protein